MTSYQRVDIIILVFQIMRSSDDGEEVTPVPIPNTEVKLFSADGSWGSPPVRVGRCQARRRSADKAGLFLCVYFGTEGS